MTNSKRLPAARSVLPTDTRIPTLVRGGTREIAMATPGSVSETSRRPMANAPASPVARASQHSTDGAHAASNPGTRRPTAPDTKVHARPEEAPGATSATCPRRDAHKTPAECPCSRGTFRPTAMLD